jgi:4a-hydroxytetrahydrobiopterin dehydratase
MGAKTSEWLSKRCKPCEGGVKPLDLQEAKQLISELPGWKLREDGKAIQKEYSLKNFREVIGFFNEIAEVCEAENHHPELKISYRRVGVEFSTHSIKGLSENDFILAAKFDRCYAALNS